MNYPNYRNFYQMALIPIGLKDRESFLEHQETSLLTTHWLIALEAEEGSQLVEFYFWKVLLFPSDSGGSFSCDHVIYSSSPINSINEAIILARTFETFCKNDELHAADLQEKIS